METIYFANNKTVRFDNLRQAIDKDGNRVYDENLLQELESGNFYYLNNIDLVDRNNRYFMEPLLYAVRNSEYGTYEIYRYYGEELQKMDLNIATEIVIEEPDVIEYTAISDKENIILHLVRYNPEVIIYMSEDLKSDGEFIEQLCETGNKEVIMLAARECNISDVLQDNPDLANNPEFMKEVIKDDVTMLTNASEDLKDNHKFIKDICKENKAAIDYIAENTSEFGKEGLGAAKVVLAENTTSKAIEGFKSELEELQKKKEEPQEENKDLDTEKARKEAAIKERQLKNSIKFLEKIKNGEVKPERAIRLINSLCDNLGEEYREEIMKYIKLDDAVIERQKEEKEKESEGYVIEPKDIEEKVNDAARLPKVKEEKDTIEVKTQGSRVEELTDDID